MLARLGCFFLLIAAGLLALFVFSLQTSSSQPALLAYGILLLAFGLIMRVRGRQPPEPRESRFRVLRRRRTDTPKDQ